MEKVLKNFEKKILYLLDLNSRMSLNKMAKILKTSPQKVDYTVKNLLNKKIINDFITIIDYKKMGYTVGFVYYELKSVDIGFWNSMLDYVKSNEDILVVLEGIGKYDLALGFFFKDFFSLEEKTSKFKNMFYDHIYRDVKVVHLGAYRGRRDYLIKEFPELDHKLDRPVILTGGKTNILNFKKVDIDILSLISKNSRMHISSMSKKLGITTSTISSRLKYLSNNGVIVGNTIIPNLLNYPYKAYRVLIKSKKITEKEEKRFLLYLRTHQNVIQSIRNFGEYSFTIDVEVSDALELRKFMTTLIKKFEGVINKYDIMDIHKIHKFTYFPSKIKKHYE